MNAPELDSTTIYSHSEKSTQRVAAAIATYCKPGDCLLLQGDLGAGKTTFARGFIQTFLPEIEVTSPTFNLVQTYDAVRASLWHFDLYRLKSTLELPEIGLDEALDNGITLIEWPEIAKSYWPIHALTIKLTTSADSRQIWLLGTKQRWQELMTHLQTETTL